MGFRYGGVALDEPKVAEILEHSRVFMEPGEREYLEAVNLLTPQEKNKFYPWTPAQQKVSEPVADELARSCCRRPRRKRSATRRGGSRITS